MFIITDENNVIVYITKKAVRENDMILVDDGLETKCYLALPDLTINEVDVIPTEVKVSKYKYNKKEGFTVNKLFKENISIEKQFESLIVENKNLKQQIAQCQQSITELTALASTMLAPKM